MATNASDELPAEQVPAGDFSSWLNDIRRAIAGDQDSDVPCGTCTGCCTSSQFVHIAPDERDALAHIPTTLLFPAPRMPRGHVLMGYDEHGRCPMLVDDRCTIYEHRPRTCRTYDCRVFPAAGIVDDDESKAAIAVRVRQWRFDEDRDGQTRHAAVRAAATFLAARSGELPEADRPATPTQMAVRAVEIHDVFLDSADPPVEAVRVALTKRNRRGR